MHRSCKLDRKIKGLAYEVAQIPPKGIRDPRDLSSKMAESRNKDRFRHAEASPANLGFQSSTDEDVS